MPVDDRTPNRNYQLPNAGNLLAEDLPRLRAALQAIDADVFARYTKTEVDTLINGLIAGAPGALNTLDELATALGDDANFAATVTNALAQKANASNVYTKAEADARYVQGQVQTEMVFTATANQSVFTLSTAIINKPSALVTVDGVVQPSAEYSLNQAGTQLTLSEGVPAGTVVRVLALGVASAGAPADDTVTTPKLRDGAVTTAKVADGFLSADATGLAKMANGFLQATASGLAKMADGFLAASAAGRAKMADGFVTSDKIENETIVNADISPSAGITDSKLTGITCKARVTFDGTVAGTFAGGASTVSRTAGSTTATITTTSPHGLITGNTVAALTGVAAGSYTVTVLTANTFNITTAATTALSAVTITFNFATIRGSSGVGSVAKNGTGDYTINFSPAAPNANYSYTTQGNNQTSSLFSANGPVAAPTAAAFRFGTGGGTYTDLASVSALFFW